MKALLYALWVAALGLFLALLSYYGWADVLAALAAAGPGLLVVTLFHLIPMTIDALGWRVLMPGPTRRPFGQLLRFRWYSEAVNALLPVAQVGGEVLRGQLHARTGVAGPTAQGIVVVDLATTVYAQMAFAALGLLGLAMVDRDGGDLTWRLGATLVILTLLIGGFYLAQQRGLFSRLLGVLEAMILTEAPRSRSYARALDQTIRRLYRRRRPLLASIGFHLLAWLLGTGEIYLAATFIGAPVSALAALVLGSLVAVVRAAAFLVPGALGVQEGSFIILGALFGLAPDQALAISLIRRVRELLIGVPGLLAWQLATFARKVPSPLRSPG